MSKIVLTTAESRDAIVPTSDVVQVRIADPVHVDEEVKRASFRYHKGHLDGPTFVVDSTSGLYTIDNVATPLHPPTLNYDYFIASLSPALLPAETLRSNLDRRLLQYLLDAAIVAPGTIS